MNRITLLQDYDEKRAREALNLLLRDRRNEFRELAASLRIPSTSDDWEVIVLKFCLDFEDCFTTWTNSEEPDQNKAYKCMTIMREMVRGKNYIHELIHLQDIAYNLYTEFHQTYNRIG